MLNYEYPPLGGGQGNANKYIFKEFNKNYPGIEIDIVTSSINTGKIETYRIGRIYYLDIGKKNINLHSQSVRNLLVNSYKTFLLGFKLLKKKDYDLIVAWSGVPTGFIAFALKILFQKPYIVLLRGADVPFYDRFKWDKLDRYVLRWLSPFIWKHSKKVIANSHKLKQLALQTAPNINFEVIPNGVDTDLFRPKHCHRSPNLLLSVGRLSPIKGFDILIQAFKEAGIPDSILWIVGTGPEEAQLKNFVKNLGIEDKVEFFGFKSTDELIDLYNQASIFVLTPFNEGMSNAMMEALASGLPIICTDVGGTEELIDGNGYIVPKGDVAEIAKRIEKILKNTSLQNKFAHRSRQIALQYSWGRIAQQLYNAFYI